jgi:acyl carrier protein
LLHSEQALAASPRLAPLIAEKTGAAGVESLTRLQPSARKAAAMTAIRNEIAAVLRTDPTKISAADQLGDLGLNSLSSFELWHRIEAALVMPIPLARFTKAPTLEALSELACAIATEITCTEAGMPPAEKSARFEDSLSERSAARAKETAS